MIADRYLLSKALGSNRLGRSVRICRGCPSLGRHAAVLLGESHNSVPSYRKEVIRVRGIGRADLEGLSRCLSVY